jgi:ADP-ribose pyrophosphatase YjhB (NUDIX family)
MELFINDKRVRIFGSDKKLNFDKYNYIIKSVRGTSVNYFKKKVLVVDASPKMLIHFVDFIEDHKLKQLKCIDFVVKNPDKMIALLKEHFKIVKAAGGIVRKDDKILMIYRLKKWDLPKGKLDKGETIDECALREVEEETGVKVKNDAFFKITYHTYIRNKKRVLKETHWYLMDCIDDKKMKPQKDEGIEGVEWKTKREVTFSTQDTYRLLKKLLKRYYKRTF